MRTLSIRQGTHIYDEYSQGVEGYKLSVQELVGPNLISLESGCGKGTKAKVREPLINISKHMPMQWF